MLAAGLYLITGLAIAYQIGFTNPFTLNLPLIGAFLLIVAGIASWFKTKPGGRLALVGSIVLWIHYGPALVSLLQLATGTRSVAINWGAQVPALLLVLTSFVSLFVTVA